MRILQFGRYNYSQIKGGVQYFAELLSVQLAINQNYPVEIDEIVSGTNLKTEIVRFGRRTLISVPQYGNFKSVPVSPGIFLWSWKLLISKKYDVIHLNFPDPLALLAILFYPKLKSKIVVTWHADIVKQKLLLRFYQPWVRLFMKKVDAVIVATPLHIDSCLQLKNSGYLGPIHVAPFGIEKEKWQIQAQHQKEADGIKARLDSKKLVLFAFGRHVYYKGFEFLIEAMKETPNAILLLGGSGPLTSYYRELIQKNKIEDRIQMIGQVPESKLIPYFLASDVFVFPSVDQTEAFGYAQVEAMICGLPVISTWLGNGVNFVNIDQVTGLVVPARDSTALATAILKMSEDSQMRKVMADKAQQRALELFTSDQTAEKIFKIFEATLQNEKSDSVSVLQNS